MVIGGELGANFGFPAGLLDRDDVEELGQWWVRALGALAAHAARPDAGGRTPTDLPLVEVTQRDIDVWEAEYPGATDVWPLAPLQSGLLYHALLAEGQSDVYSTQVLIHLTGLVDPARLRGAANALLARYPNLRTAFVSGESGEPLQVVVDDVVLPWRELDLTGQRNPVADTVELDAVLRADQDVAFDLAAPPLIRFTMVRTGAESWTLAVTSHHILLDGWSMPLLMKDLLVLYATSGDAEVLGRVPSYRSYLEWLSRRHHGDSVDAWVRALEGVDEPTLLVGAETDGAGATSAEHHIDLGRDRSDTLGEVAARLGLTVNTVLQGAWATLIARTTGRDDVVFGTTVSGRRPTFRASNRWSDCSSTLCPSGCDSTTRQQPRNCSSASRSIRRRSSTTIMWVSPRSSSGRVSERCSTPCSCTSRIRWTEAVSQRRDRSTD